jgi:hypothetical protein
MSEPMTRYPFSRVVLGCVQVLGWVIGGAAVVGGIAGLKAGDMHGVGLIVTGVFGAAVNHAVMAMGQALFDLVDLQSEARTPPKVAPRPGPAPEPVAPVTFTHEPSAPRPRPETLLEQEPAPTAPQAFTVRGELPKVKPLDESDLARLERAARTKRDQ